MHKTINEQHTLVEITQDEVRRLKDKGNMTSESTALLKAHYINIKKAKQEALKDIQTHRRIVTKFKGLCFCLKPIFKWGKCESCYKNSIKNYYQNKDYCECGNLKRKKSNKCNTYPRNRVNWLYKRIELLKMEHGKVYKTSELCIMMNYRRSSDWIYTCLNKLITMGIIKKISKGKYTLT